MPINNLTVDVSGIGQCKIVSLNVKGLEVRSIKLHQQNAHFHNTCHKKHTVI